MRVALFIAGLAAVCLLLAVAHDSAAWLAVWIIGAGLALRFVPGEPDTRPGYPADRNREVGR